MPAGLERRSDLLRAYPEGGHDGADLEAAGSS